MVCFGCFLSGIMLCIFSLLLKIIYVKLKEYSCKVRAWLPLMQWIGKELCEEWPCEY